jgi:hypothetical protein
LEARANGICRTYPDVVQAYRVGSAAGGESRQLRQLVEWTKLLWVAIKLALVESVSTAVPLMIHRTVDVGRPGGGISVRYHG